MGSALLNTAADLEFVGTPDNFIPTLTPTDPSAVRQQYATSAPSTADALRMQVAERLAAHRSRRGATQAQAAEPVRPAPAGRSAQIAAAVAERYARTPSYREMLAAEAERAIQQARAAAEVAALNAQAIAAAQQRLLAAYDEHQSREQATQQKHSQTTQPAVASPDQVTKSSAAFPTATAVAQDLWPDLAIGDAHPKDAESVHAAKPTQRPQHRTQPSKQSAASESHTAGYAARTPQPGLTVRLYDYAGHFKPLSAHPTSSPSQARVRSLSEELTPAEASALDDEIAFRHTPVFEEPAGPALALPANLIEFPRQLIAARKARPRYAEGPLREEMEAAASDGQLRIFEVDPAEISTQPAEAQPPQWTSIWLDAPAPSVRTAHANGNLPAHDQVPADEMDALPGRAVPALQPASIARRAAAGAINLAIVLCGLLAFATVFTAVAGRGISGPARAANAAGLLAQTQLQPHSAMLIAAVSTAFLLLVYHALFFWFSTATPGMRSVRIALCTFDDENPARRTVRRRMLATLLSACPLGMGFAWAALDEQRLTWHDRISRVYLRRY